MGLELISFNDNPAAGTTTVVVRDPHAVEEEEDDRVVGPAAPAPGIPGVGPWRWWPHYQHHVGHVRGPLPTRAGVVGPPIYLGGGYTAQVNVVGAIANAGTFTMIRVVNRHGDPITYLNISAVAGTHIGATPRPADRVYRVFIPHVVAVESIGVTRS
jgi:hypothetical protein